MHFMPIPRLGALLLAISLLSLLRAAAPDPDKSIERTKLTPAGQWEEATVPDTLDLAERANLVINVLTRGIESTKAYSVYHIYNFGATPTKPEMLTWNITGKYTRVLPLMRTMCGSTQNLDVEYEMMRVRTSAIDKGGQVRYFPIDQKRPTCCRRNL